MVRTRLAAVAVAAGLGFASGCAELSQHSLFSRLHDTTCSGPVGCCPGECASGCCEPVCDGPILEGGAPFVGQPAYPVAPPPTIAPQAPSGDVMPQLTSPPRLVPQPQQAQPVPYTPSYQSRTAGR